MPFRSPARLMRPSPLALQHRTRPLLPSPTLISAAARASSTRTLHSLPHPRPCLRPSRATLPSALPPQSRHQSTYRPLTLTDDEYHFLSDQAMDNMLESLEEAIDLGVGRSAEEGWEVSYSSGVLTLSCGPHGTYVINKQPPNQQIWLSSPQSGPKRYDYSVPLRASASADASGSAPGSPSQRSTAAGGKEGEEREGMWVYHRDGSTLRGLLESELTGFAGEKVEVWVERREGDLE